jgi:hypothetical protein
MAQGVGLVQVAEQESNRGVRNDAQERLAHRLVRQVAEGTHRGACWDDAIRWPGVVGNFGAEDRIEVVIAGDHGAADAGRTAGVEEGRYGNARLPRPAWHDARPRIGGQSRPDAMSLRQPPGQQRAVAGVGRRWHRTEPAVRSATAGLRQGEEARCQFRRQGIWRKGVEAEQDSPSCPVSHLWERPGCGRGR